VIAVAWVGSPNGGRTFATVMSGVPTIVSPLVRVAVQTPSVTLTSYAPAVSVPLVTVAWIWFA